MPRPTPRRRGLRTTTSLAASLVLAATMAATPAHSTSTTAVTAAADASSSTVPLAPDPARGSATAPTGERPDRRSEEVYLESTSTSREGTVDLARTPKVVKRSARLWLNSSVDFYPPDQQDVSRVSVDQDLTKNRIVVEADYYARPTAALNSAVLVYLGSWDKNQSRCTGKAVVGGSGHGSAADAIIVDTKGKSLGTATRSMSGTTLRVTATGAGAKNAKYDCVYAFLDTVDDSGQQIQLKSSGAEHFTAEIEKHPKFTFYSGDLHAAYPGKWNKVRISIRNDGNLTAKNVKLRLSGSKLKFKKKTIKVGTIKAGKSKAVNVQVKLSGKKTRTLKAKATASGKWTATAKTKVGYRPKPKKVKSLAGRSYWASTTGSGSDAIWQVHGLTFVNNKWVYVGVPKSGTPKCSKKVKECKRYSYSAKKGTLKIGKLRAKVNSEGVKVTKPAKKSDPKVMYTPLKGLKKGSKISAKLEYIDGSGPCPPSCRSWWDKLTLKKNGTFTRNPGSISTFGFIPYQTFVSTSGPVKKGTYKILSKNRIRFTWKDAETGKTKKETRTIGIDQNELGKHNPKYGLLIGDDPYLP